MAYCISDSDEEFVEDTSSLGISPYSVASDESGSDSNDSGSESDPSEDRTSNSTWYMAGQ